MEFVPEALDSLVLKDVLELSELLGLSVGFEVLEVLDDIELVEGFELAELFEPIEELLPLFPELSEISELFELSERSVVSAVSLGSELLWGEFVASGWLCSVLRSCVGSGGVWGVVG